MTILGALRRILNDSPGSATDIDFNFQSLESFTTTELISRDGSVAMTSPLVGVPAVNNNEYATLAQITGASGVIPVSSMVPYGGDTAPPGWVLCDGAAYSSTDPTYQALFAVIGYKFGDAGGGNFRVPDMRTRVVAGAGSGFTLGAEGGTADHTVVSHTHTGTTEQDNHNHQQWIRKNLGYQVQLVTSGPRESVPAMAIDWLPERTSTDFHNHTFTTNSTGNSGEGKNYPPYVVFNHIMYIG